MPTLEQCFIIPFAWLLLTGSASAQDSAPSAATSPTAGEQPTQSSTTSNTFKELRQKISLWFQGGPPPVSLRELGREPIIRLSVNEKLALSGQPQPAPMAPAGLSILQAVQITIDINPILRIQEQQLLISRGALMAQRSIFDTNVGSRFTTGRNDTPLPKANAILARKSGIDTETTNSNTVTTNISGSKLFHSGISITPTVQLNRSTDNLLNQTGQNNSQVAVDVRLPLLRGHGRTAVAAGEIAAGFEVDATALDLSQTASQLIANTASIYWQYLGTVQSVEIYRNSETRGRELLGALETLVNADIVERSQLPIAVANLASRSSSRLQAEQNMVTIRQALAIAMGIGPDQINDIPPPIDPYPSGSAQSLLPMTPEALRGYIQTALACRADYLAAKRRTREVEALVVGSKNQIKPQVDFVLRAGYTGLQETTRFDKYLSSIFQNLGPNVSGSIEYRFPLENRAAKGQLIQIQGKLQQSQLRINDIARSVASNVVTATTGLNNSVLQLQQAEQAAQSFLTALNNERERLRLGAGSVLNILQTEDRYINAALNEISTRVQYAVAIVNFRLATGTYLIPDQPVQAVDRTAFYVPLTF